MSDKVPWQVTQVLERLDSAQETLDRALHERIIPHLTMIQIEKAKVDLDAAKRTLLGTQWLGMLAR